MNVSEEYAVEKYGAHIVMRAHQYLYYVKEMQCITDRQYDEFCERHSLFGGGGSDNKDDYSEHVRRVAFSFVN